MAIVKTTLRQQVQEVLYKEITELYKPGDLLPGEKHLAVRFKVSILTVREAIQGLVDMKLIERRQGIGTIILSARARRKDLPVGILVEIDVTHPNTSPNYLNQALGLKAELEKRGHQARLFLGKLPPGEKSPEPICPEFTQARKESSLKAVIAVSSTSIAWREQCEAAGIPVVCLSNVCPWGVSVDQSYFITQAVDDLMKRGCRKLALMAWDGRRHSKVKERSEAFRAALEKAGLCTNGRWIFTGVEPSLNGAGWEAMREIWSAESERPDGVIVTDDMLLRGALLAIHELRISVPAELSIAALVVPGQTNTGSIPTINYEMPLDDIANEIVNLVEERLENETAEPRKIVLKPRKNKDAQPAPLLTEA